GDVPAAQVLQERVRVDLAPRHPGGEERLDLRCEAEPPGAHAAVEERLDAQPVAGEHETLDAAIPDREREHSVQPGHRVGPVLLVEVDDRLAVARRAEPMATRLEGRTELAIVVDLAVAHDPHGACLVLERLRAALHVDDGEPAMPERDLPVGPPPLTVRAAVGERGGHPADESGVDGVGADADQPCDCAHRTVPYASDVPRSSTRAPRRAFM